MRGGGGWAGYERCFQRMSFPSVLQVSVARSSNGLQVSVVFAPPGGLQVSVAHSSSKRPTGFGRSFLFFLQRPTGFGHLVLSFLQRPTGFGRLVL
jgi:hypothetical protein